MWWSQLQMKGGQLGWLGGRQMIPRVLRMDDSKLAHCVKSSIPTSGTFPVLTDLLRTISQTLTPSPSLGCTVRAGESGSPGFSNTVSFTLTSWEEDRSCQAPAESQTHCRRMAKLGALPFGPAISADILLLGHFSRRRLFASRTGSKRRESNKAIPNASLNSSATTQSASVLQLPSQKVKLTFEDCLRKFAPLIDSLEDRRASYTQQPEFFNKMLAENARSSGKLLAFLDSILPQATGLRYPKAASYDLVFFVPRDGEPVQKVRLGFSTTGGDCRKKVHEQFKRFFEECKVASDFRWSPGSWGGLHITGKESELELREKARMIRQSHEGPSEEDVLVAGSGESLVGEDDVSSSHVGSPRDGTGSELRASEEGVKTQTEAELESEGVSGGEVPVSTSNERYGEHGSIFSTGETPGDEAEEGVTSIEELIHTLDPALKLIAEHAWGEQDEETSKGVLEMLESLRKSSPLLGEAVSEKIWNGRLVLESVCEGLDDRDVAIAMSIVFHTHRLFEKKGRPRRWEQT